MELVYKCYRWTIVGSTRAQTQGLLLSHPVLSPTTFHLKPSMVTQISCYLASQSCLWQTSNVTHSYVDILWGLFT